MQPETEPILMTKWKTEQKLQIVGIDCDSATTLGIFQLIAKPAGD